MNEIQEKQFYEDVFGFNQITSEIEYPSNQIDYRDVIRHDFGRPIEGIPPLSVAYSPAELEEHQVALRQPSGSELLINLRPDRPVRVRRDGVCWRIVDDLRAKFGVLERTQANEMAMREEIFRELSRLAPAMRHSHRQEQSVFMLNMLFLPSHADLLVHVQNASHDVQRVLHDYKKLMGVATWEGWLKTRKNKFSRMLLQRFGPAYPATTRR